MLFEEDKLYSVLQWWTSLESQSLIHTHTRTHILVILPHGIMGKKVIFSIHNSFLSPNYLNKTYFFIGNHKSSDSYRQCCSVCANGQYHQCFWASFFVITGQREIHYPCIKTFASLSDCILSSRMRCPQRVGEVRKGWEGAAGRGGFAEWILWVTAHHRIVHCCSILRCSTTNNVLMTNNYYDCCLNRCFHSCVVYCIPMLLSCLIWTVVICRVTWMQMFRTRSLGPLRCAGSAKLLPDCWRHADRKQNLPYLSEHELILISGLKLTLHHCVVYVKLRK